MQDDLIDIVIVGAHLSGMPLNHELTSLESRFLREDITAPVYRLYELPETSPSKPGLLRVASGGAPVAVEVWALAPAAFGRFVAKIPSPLSIGKIQLADSSSFAANSTTTSETAPPTRNGNRRSMRAMKPPMTDATGHSPQVIVRITPIVRPSSGPGMSSCRIAP